MYNNEINNNFELYTTILSQVIQDDLEVMSQSSAIKSIDIKLISLDRIKLTNDIEMNRVYLEFLLFVLHLDEIIPDIKELYIEHIGIHGYYHDLIAYYDVFDQKLKELEQTISAYGKTLMFVGWSKTKNKFESCTAGFIVGYENE